MIDLLVGKPSTSRHFARHFGTSFALLVGALLFCSGCASQSTSPLPLTSSLQSTVGSPAISGKTSAVLATNARPYHIKFVYIADVAKDALLVYGFGQERAAPIRTVLLNDTPQGVVTDSTGNVYVALFRSSSVQEYTPGARRLIRTITSGLYAPVGVAIDRNDNLYVASHCSTPNCTAGFVVEFHRDAQQAFATVQDLRSFAVEGVAVDAGGKVWMDSYSGPGGYGLRFVNGDWDQTKIAMVSSDGIALDAAQNVYAASVDMVTEFASNNLKGIGKVFHKYGVGHAVRLIGCGPDGSLVVPVQAEARYGGPVVDVFTSTAQAPFRITRGLRSPYGAAAGI